MGIEKLGTEIRREQIAHAALGLIAARGMKGLSMAGLAQRVQLVPSAIYRHFKNKDQVLDAVLDLLRDRLLGNVDVVMGVEGSALEHLRRLLELHGRLILEYQAMPRILFSEEVYGGNTGRKTKLRAIITTYLGAVEGIVRRGQEAAEIRSDVDPATVALIFLGLVQPSAILWHLSEGQFDVGGHIERAWPILEEAIKRKE